MCPPFTEDFFNGHGKEITDKSAIVYLLFEQNVLQDMESKRPQLEQVLNTARDLQKQRMSEEDKKILKDRGEGSRSKVKSGTWNHFLETMTLVVQFMFDVKPILFNHGIKELYICPTLRVCIFTVDQLQF